MDAGTLKVQHIFGSDKRYIVPLFQRPYVWNKEDQWRPLWNDVETLASRIYEQGGTRPHFLGAIVLDQVPQPTGQVETRLIVDGQQRLTTIQLLLEAFSDACAARGVDKYHRALQKLTRNDDPISDDPDEDFKVWPTNADREHFRSVMRAADPDEVRDLYGRASSAKSVGHPIADAYLRFYGWVDRWIDEVDDLEKRVHSLYAAVKENLRLVAIDLDSQDDPQVIFETLNARGTPLLASDLIKNFLFHQPRTDGGNLRRLYEQYWSPFDESQSYWRKEIGRGHARRPRIDTYLQHYLMMRTAEEVEVSHLYTSFREYGEQELEGGVEGELASIREYGAIYRSFDERSEKMRVGRFFLRLRTMNVTSAYPFLLELFGSLEEDDEQLLAVLGVTESFLVRRMVCRLTTRGYARLFVEAVTALRNLDGAPLDRVCTYFTESEADARRWPDDAEFRNAWTSSPLYRRLSQSRVRMMLEALERKMRTKKSEEISFGNDLPIEHLLPQSWQAHYPLPDDLPEAEALARRQELLHSMGNLTLLTQSLNSSVSNGPWEEKKREILKHSALALNRELGEEDCWDENAIEERSRALFEDARKVWPGPAEFVS